MRKEITCSLKIHNNKENPISEFSFLVEDSATRTVIHEEADSIASDTCLNSSDGWMYDYKIIGVESYDR
tara:strand:- start:64 stop:270 length:207 start_codon:yes stop_codon:yes gene_type:complete